MVFFKGRDWGHVSGEATLRLALSLARTIGLAREQGEVPATWALWAGAWCFFVGVLVARGLQGMAPLDVLMFLRSLHEQSEAYPSKRDALNGARVLRLRARAATEDLAPPYRDAAGRVVDAWAELVARGLEGSSCYWCTGERVSERDAGACPAGRCETCGPYGGPRVPPSPGEGVEVWGLRYRLRVRGGAADWSEPTLTRVAMVPLGAGWLLLESEALGLPTAAADPVTLVYAYAGKLGSGKCDVMVSGVLSPRELAEHEAKGEAAAT